MILTIFWLRVLKTLELPRISILEIVLMRVYFSVSNAIAIDDSINEKKYPKSLDILDLNNPEELINWIDKNAKRVLIQGR